MKTPLEITFRGFSNSEAVSNVIRDKFQKLTRYSALLESGHVIVSSPHKHHRKGKQFHVQLELTVPGQVLVVSHDPGNNNAHEDVYIAIRDTFSAAERGLKSYAEQRRTPYRKCHCESLKRQVLS